MKITNLFNYATSELSQDAFICWLLSHATADGYDVDPQIRECAIDFLKEILKKQKMIWTNEMRITKIERQYKNIDVLVVIDDLYIIIEDKTFTGSHHDQINRYKETLLKKGYANKSVDPDKVICVYYKIIEQPFPELNVDFEFTRDVLLSIFRNYKDIIRNPIFADYLEYLKWIDSRVNSYKCTDIKDWCNDGYRGFFKELGNTYLKDKGYGWGYVSNPSGGFMGLWWYDILCDDDFNKMGLSEDVISNLYLQIEKNEIAVKYSVDKSINPDYSKIGEVRWKIYEYLRKKLGDDFYKKTYRNGKYMTIGCMRYNKDNCICILDKLQASLLEMRDTFQFVEE